MKINLTTPRELKEMPPPEWILKDVLQKDSTALLYGPPGLGKSFLALEMAFAIVGQHNGIFQVEHTGPVVYVLGEGLSGIGVRIKAWEMDRNIVLDEHPEFVGQSIQLASMKSRKDFIAAIKDKLDEPPALIVFDTLARCAVGMDENSAKDMGLVVDGVELIRKEFGSTVLLVHHSTKASPKTERGSGAIYGAVDTALSLSADGKKYLKLQCQKQKNGEASPSRSLELKPISDVSCVVRADRDAKTLSVKEQFIEAVTCGTKLTLPKKQFYDFAYPPLPWKWDGCAPIISVTDPGGTRIILEPTDEQDPDYQEWLKGPKTNGAYITFPEGTDFERRATLLRQRKAGELKQLCQEGELEYWFPAMEGKAVSQAQVADWYGLSRSTLRRQYLRWKG